MASNINKQVFNHMSEVADKTNVDLFSKPAKLDKKDIHNALDAIGMVPGIGEPADALNAFLYSAEGKYKDAAISVAAMIPIIGGTKNAKKLLEFAKEVRMKKANDLANEMTDKGKMWNKHMNWEGDLAKPLRGKYKEIPKLREEIDKIDLELEKDYYLRTIGRIPKFLEGK